MHAYDRCLLFGSSQYSSILDKHVIMDVDRRPYRIRGHSKNHMMYTDYCKWWR